MRHLTSMIACSVQYVQLLGAGVDEAELSSITSAEFEIVNTLILPQMDALTF